MRTLQLLLTMLALCCLATACANGGVLDPESACDNSLDDDADGDVDCDDRDCRNNAACVLIPERCDDGVDNDEDGRTDCVDPDCNGDAACGGDDAEDCGDGADNDGDGDTDCDDTDCSQDRICSDPDAEICSDGDDNDGDGDTDCEDSDCRNDPDCSGANPEICGNGADDDGDGDTDCDDDDCADDPGCGGAVEDCTDGVDNDDDAAADCDDPDCADDPACGPPAERCGDGVDNDRDGQTDCDDDDCVADPACVQTETNCTDGLDNDDDNAIDCGDEDCRNDPACGRPETDCSNGQDDDNDGRTDCDDSDCDLALACREIETLCDDGQDNDNDNATDCDDADCAGTPACTETNCADNTDNDDDGAADCDDSDCVADPACVVDLCDEPTPLTTEGSFTGTTAGESQFTAGGDCAGDGRGPEALYVLTVDVETPVCLTTEGSAFDTVLYVRSDCRDTDTQLACNDDAFDQGLGTRSLVEFQARPGTEYIVFVDAFISGGAYTLNARFSPCTEAAACGDGVDNDDDGDIDCADDDCDGTEDCTETGDECSDDNDNDGDNLTDCDDPDCDNAPACIVDSCEGATVIDGPGVFTGDSSDLENNFRGSCGGNGPEALFTLSVDADSTVCLDTNGAAYDTVLYVRTTCADDQTQVVCDDDGGDGTRSLAEFEATAGTEYAVFVDGFSFGGEYSLRVRHEACDTPIPDEICDSGEDEDRDGLVDCEDPDCVAEPVCLDSLCDNAPEISAEGTFTAQTRDGVNNFRGSCGGGGNEAIWRLSTTTDTTVCVDTFDADFDTVLYARTACGDTDSQIVCNDDSPGNGTRSQIEFEATAFTDYLLFADAFTTGFGGDVQMRVRFTTCDTPLPE